MIRSRLRLTPSAAALGFAVTALTLALAVTGCSAYQPFDSQGHLRDQYRQLVPPETAAQLQVPFELGPEVQAEVEARLRPLPDQRRRVDQVLDYVFGRLGLQYSLTPTRDATGTFMAREGNCLSFVNLFVGIARQLDLAPFYVEVEDYQRWNLRDGLVVSQGHIVAGMYVKGELATYDFLPYRPKSYRSFKPIDDLTAAAHFYNNLGAEALIRGDEAEAQRLLELAVAIGPEFLKGINNLGVTRFRSGDLQGAETIYEKGLSIDPENVPILTNLARVHQRRGEAEKAMEVLSRIDGANNTNPFFFIYKGELALAQGDFPAALEAMREALSRDNEIPEVHLALVKVYLAMGELAKARHHVARALRLDATHSEAREYAALLDRQAGTDGTGTALEDGRPRRP